MKNMKYMAALLLSVPAWTGCENDGFFYRDEPRVRLEGPGIWTLGTDSLEFSFVTSPTEVTEYRMDVDICVMGYAEDRDRTANLVVDEARTTAPAALYEVPSSVVVPAGANKATFSVVLKRDVSLQEKTVGLYIKVTESDDFSVGAGEQDHLLLKWNDILSRPKNWDRLEEYFGTYSNAKYRFMLNNSDGVSDFDPDTMSWAELMNYKIKFTSALNEYNAAHPGAPLTDENGVLVDFNN